LEGFKRWIALLATITLLLLSLMSGLISAAPNKEWKEDEGEQSSVIGEEADEEGLGDEVTAGDPCDDESNAFDESESSTEPEDPDSDLREGLFANEGPEVSGSDALLLTVDPELPLTGNGVEPELFDPWQSGDAEDECAQAGCSADYAWKLNAAAPNGVYPTGQGNTITITNSDGYYFDWSSVWPVTCVIVVRGNIAHVFYYCPDGSYDDTGLYGPLKEDGTPYEISHVTFCFNAPEEGLGSICGTKWEDLDCDGLGDITVDGVTIILLDEQGKEVERTKTSDGGKYCFKDLEPGTYTVMEDLSVDDLDEDWYPKNPLSGRYEGIVLAAGQEITGKDFVNARYGSICGIKWEDLDCDGEGDIPVEGVTVELWQKLELNDIISAAALILNGDGWTYLTETKTAADGSYCFEGLMPGLYKVREVLDEDQEKEWYFKNPESGELEVTLGCGENAEGKDFVNARYLSISGTKWDGPNDTPVEGILIELLQNGEVIETTVTDVDGKYSFSGLKPGTYTVKEALTEEQLEEWYIVSPEGGIYEDLALVCGQPIEDLDFVNARYGSISGYKYEDMNGDGVPDADDPGFEGVTINLMQGDEIVATTTTDEDGMFSFEKVIPGTYDIEELLDVGVNTKASPIISGVIVVSGKETVLDESVGQYFLNYRLGSITGFKYLDFGVIGAFDEDDDKRWDGKTNPIIIELLKVGDDKGKFASVDSEGVFFFGELEPGTYIVREVTPLPADVVSSKNNEVKVTVRSGENVVLGEKDYFLNYFETEVAPEIITPPEQPAIAPQQLPRTGWDQLPLMLAAAVLVLLGLMALALGIVRFNRS
jgi:protocatechuate 3,4-dioxygenase beta subunit